MIDKAAFSLDDYMFERVSLDLRNIKPVTNFDIEFIPNGVFYPETGVFRLTFDFIAKVEAKKAVTVKCIANFKFENISSLENIPEYFYANSIAILFPYIRAFISTVTLQANIKPLLLPTLNLSSLQAQLKANTSVVNE